MRIHRHPSHNTIIETLLGGFDNWDSEYFIHIAQHGYTSLQTNAFFPLYPTLMWLVGKTLLFLFNIALSDRSLFLFSGVLINFIAFPMSALALYTLTVLLTNNYQLSFFSGLFFCFNPASVFMSAVYTETLFALFTFVGFCLLTSKWYNFASVLFALASATRSNGITLAAFIAYCQLIELYHVWQKNKSWLELTPLLLKKALMTMVQCFVVVVPFIIFQFYGYWQYCIQSSDVKDHYSWCYRRFPMPYSYIQEHYWNVGFLRYFHLKQIPNFLLALPMILTSVLVLWHYFRGKHFIFPEA